MSGIVGLITKIPRARAESQLQRMVQSMLHEPSYTSGTWIDEALGIYVGWVARRGSFCDDMPLRDESDNLVLIFSGEEFPQPGTALRLKHEGHANDIEGPSYLVHLAQDSADFPRELNGRFHGLLIRRVAGEAILFNDRYGMHRLHFHKSQDAFYFAAEAKAILAVCPALRAIDPRSLGEFIACGCTLENRTIFNGIALLPPASAWKFRNSSLQREHAYFDPREWEEQPLLAEEEFYLQLKDVFSRNLPRYFGGREKIAMSLTGGLDSRMILSWHQPAPHSLPCYSFGSIYRDCQDVVMARKIATTIGQDHSVIPVADDFLSRFAHYAERTVYLTDGSVEVKRAPDLYVNEHASRIAPIRMTGNYGGEVLRQTRAFKPVKMSPGLFHPDLDSSIERAHEAYARIVQGHPLSFSVFRQAPWHLYCSLGLEQSQLSLRSPYLDNDLVRTVFRAPCASVTGDAVCLRLIADGSPTLRRLRTDRGMGGQHSHLVAAAQQAYLEFTFKAEYAYDYGMPQPVARIDHAVSPLHLERLFLGRHKFYHFRVWYRDALADYVREMLLDSRSLSRPYIQRDALENLVDRHLKGDCNYTNELHRLLTLEHLHRLFIDPN
jgi:asparagine synthase (glutamine-hydrolysing)